MIPQVAVVRRAADVGTADATWPCHAVSCLAHLRGTFRQAGGAVDGPAAVPAIP
jgi:hypothetical protein